MKKKALLAGCGNQRVRLIQRDGNNTFDEFDLVTLDHSKASNPDIVWDLTVPPLPFEDDTFDEIHMYEVLEHIGAQGDFRLLFWQFSDYWRILKEGGMLCATVPGLRSKWLWGDPGHTRVIAPGTLTFLDQEEYLQCGHTTMADYRDIYKADFKLVFSEDAGDVFAFALEAIKPARTFSEAWRQKFIERIKPKTPYYR